MKQAMKYLICHDNVLVPHARGPARSSRQSASAGWPLPQRSEAWKKVMFVLDARGRIQYWSTPESLSNAGNALLGQPIRHLVPHLPLRDKTPGYNIAFARLSFAEDQWLPYHVRMADTSLHPAEIHLKTIPLERGFCLLGLARLQEQERYSGVGAHALLMDFASYQNERRAVAPITFAL